MERINLIKKWIDYSPPDRKIIDEIKKFGWDFDGKPFILKAEHIIKILKRYHRNDLTRDEVTEWADFIEMREDIDYLIYDDIIFHLAAPEINNELTKNSAKEYIKDLNTKR